MKILATLCLVVLCGCGKDPNSELTSTASSGPSTAFDGSARTAPLAEPTEPSGPTAPLDGSCFKPLTSYCGDARPCPTYSARVDYAQEFGSSGACLQALIGKCDELRYVRLSDGFVSSKEYFDSAGSLVALRGTTDVMSQNATCPNWTHYGPRVTCAEVVTMNYCER